MAEPAAPRRRPHPVATGTLAAAACLVAMWPYTAVIAPGAWTFVVVVVIVVTAIAGMAGRSLFGRLGDGIRSLLTAMLQVAALALTCTNLIASETAQSGFFPTPASIELTRLRLQRAVHEISNGVAPIDATAAMTTAMGLAFAVVALLVDHLLAQRMIMLAVLFTSIVGAAPMLLSFGAVNIVWFVMQAVIILLVLRFGARHDRGAVRHSPYVVAGLMGAAAIAVTAVLAPALPLTDTLAGNGPMPTVSADLRLGDDLRQPNETEVLTVVTSAAAAPYLRLATLSRFDGDVWRPDRTDRNPVDEGFGPRPWREQIKTVEHEVSVRVTGVSSDRLPVPYAAEKVSGLPGGWLAMPANRTVFSATQDAAGSDYTVEMASPLPTLEQIRAADAAGGDVTAEPAEDLPPVIGELAREVTADASTDYDRLIALQNWFRSEFSYSLDAPVDEGFDGTGADAVATFLDVRSGYCIHFAGAFALMAQTLDMPVRIVVGYLPGRATDQKRGEARVYSVTSDQLHSWPEVFFEGIGWVPFEPTATLGTPTEFAASAGAGGDSGTDSPTPTASASPTPTSSATGAPDRRDEDPGASGDGGLRRLDPTPIVLVVGGLLAVLLLPTLVRWLRRMLRLSRARRGDAIAAWSELADTMVDLGVPLRASDTARTRAQSLVATRGVDAGSLRALVDAVELRSYAEQPTDGADLREPLTRVLGQLEASVSGQRRVAARMLPTSLLPRRRARGEGSGD